MRLAPLYMLTTGLLALPACAQTALDEDALLLAYGDNATVSIATGSQQPLRRAPAVATVITAEEIAAMGATDLAQVLETVPGMHVSRTVFYAPLFTMRGIQSNPSDSRTLLLQNGIPMTTMYLGDKGQNWGGMPLENIARIEIIRGPGSALYGADAYAGVINVVTRAAGEVQGTRVGARAGSFGSYDGWMLHGGKLGAVDVAAYLRTGTSEGFRETVAADAQSARDARFGSGVSLAPGETRTGYEAIDGGLEFSQGPWRLRLGYVRRDRMGVGAGVSSTLDPRGEHRSERITTDLGWSAPAFARDWSVGAQAAFTHYAETMASPYQLAPAGAVFPTGSFGDGMIGDPDRYERQLRLSAFATYGGLAGHSLRFGIGHDDLDMYDTGTHKNYLLNAAGVPVPTGAVIDYGEIQPHLQPHRRKLSYLYAQDEWALARDWALTAGLRYDRYSDFGSTTNPRLALVWDAAYDLTAKLMYGSAFRAPSFNELYGTNPVASGNAELKPETIDTLEAALGWQLQPRLQLNLSLFRYVMEDLIRAVPNALAGTGATYRNSGRQRGHGAELELAWDVLPTLHLGGYYAWQRATDEASGEDAGYLPRHHLNFGADWRAVPGWRLASRVNWVAGRQRAAGDSRDDIPDYTTMDLVLRTERSRGQWDFSLVLRNLFDAQVTEPSLAPGLIPDDLPQAPRSVFLQAVYKL